MREWNHWHDRHPQVDVVFWLRVVEQVDAQLLLRVGRVEKLIVKLLVYLDRLFSIRGIKQEEQRKRTEEEEVEEEEKEYLSFQIAIEIGEHLHAKNFLIIELRVVR